MYWKNENVAPHSEGTNLDPELDSAGKVRLPSPFIPTSVHKGLTRTPQNLYITGIPFTKLAHLSDSSAQKMTVTIGKNSDPYPEASFTKASTPEPYFPKSDSSAQLSPTRTENDSYIGESRDPHPEASFTKASMLLFTKVTVLLS